MYTDIVGTNANGNVGTACAETIQGLAGTDTTEGKGLIR
ncbi:hypothetical protein MIDIC_340034 [Alphaproteobacteria bacterium]